MTNKSSRREFLQATAAAAVGGKTVLLDAETAAGSQGPVAASDRVRFGMIGVGMQGSGLLRTSVAIPGVECAAAADLYDGRHALAREIAGDKIRTTRRYQELLDDKTIDCVVAAVPDHWHKKIVVDAVSAGKDVYCEKPMSHSVAEGFEMVAAAQRSGRLVQIGSQRTSSALCAKAREIVAAGTIGEICLIEGSLGRNDPTGAWQYPPPPDLSPANLDWETWQGDVPKRPFDPKIFARWRCWKEYGTGVAGDLMVHLITGILYGWGRNEAPVRAMASGGILHFKDGRNMPDVHTVLFDYGAVPVYIRLNLTCETPEVARFLGTKGLLELGETGLTLMPQTGEDTGPSYYAFGLPQAAREKYFQEWRQAHDPKPGQEPLREVVTYRGPSYDEVRPHLERFFRAVKTRQGIFQDAVFGNHAALACHMANEAYFRGSPVRLDAATNSLQS